MLKIRLQRIGKKKKPTYRLVVSEKSRDLYGPQLEILGNYNPIVNPKVVEFKADRINYWLSVGAQASATVHNLLVSQGIIKAKKIQAWKPKKKEGGKDKDGNKKNEEKKEAKPESAVKNEKPEPAAEPTAKDEPKAAPTKDSEKEPNAPQK